MTDPETTTDTRDDDVGETSGNEDDAQVIEQPITVDKET